MTTTTRDLPDNGITDLGDGWFLGYERGDFDNGSLSAASVVQVSASGIHHVRECEAWKTGPDKTMLRGLVSRAGRQWPPATEGAV